MYTGVKIPGIRPATFNNYEIGGWGEIIKDHLSIDVSAYELYGTNEIVSVKLGDGSTENRNSGKTSHRGVETGVNFKPVKSVSVRFSGAYSEHKFEEFIEKGNNYNGNEMNSAPHWLHNVEVWYRPEFLKGFRLGAEWQKVGSYYMDPENTVKYKGYDVINLRAGYQYNAIEVWCNVLNVMDSYYSYISSKSGSRYSYQLAEPRNFTIGISYNLGGLIK